MGKECLLLSLWAPRAPCGNAEGTPAMIFAGWRELVFYTQKKKLSLLFLSTLHHFAVPGELDLLSALSSTQLLGFF